MNIPSITTILLTAFLLSGCESNTDSQNTQNPNKVSHMAVSQELGNLPKLMVLPHNPTLIAWGIREEKTPARDTVGILEVLLKYSKEDYQKVLEQSLRYDQPHDKVYVLSKFYYEGIPDDIKKELKTEDLSDRIQISGVEPAKPNLFTDTKLSPYVDGRIAFINDEYVLVMLYSA